MAINPMGLCSQEIYRVPSLWETGLDLSLRASSYSHCFHVLHKEIPQTGIQPL